MKGSYLLVFSLPNAARIQVGKLGNFPLKNGWYVYVGSAMNGLEQRIQRHLRTQKKIHWHIDYILPVAENIEVFYKESPTKEECNIARILEQQLNSIPGFGCSDCFCHSHLFWGSKHAIMSCVHQLNMTSYHGDANA
ncbi:MAG: GIY-YIG nuclease family protein [Candidatus Thermoplasmatota archaeon]|nr:GIY-YIG nuclease family protein [Candidatus Thermoplasmatota archaeon]